MAMLRLITRRRSLSLLTLSLLCVLASSCGEDSTSSGSPLITSRAFDPDTRCVAGGQQISVGIDNNGNATLDTDEITSTQVVCNGTSGEQGETGIGVLTRISAQDAGATCPSGGRLFEAGPDTNRNNTLDFEEVQSSNLICNGNVGPSTLLSISTEPIGESCSNGGKQLDIGFDANQNDILDAEEIASTQYVCDGGSLATRLTNIARGDATCPGGGVMLESGLDDNNDRVLGDDEVSESFDVCNRYISEVQAGLAHTCALRDDGQFYCWGSNALLQLALSEEDLFPGALTPSPRPFTKLSGVDAFALGFGHTCATTATSGQLYCWGSNSNGQLGQDTSAEFPLGLIEDPTEVLEETAPGTFAPLAGVTSFDAGQLHTCAVAGTEGRVMCWGSDSDGQLGSDRAGGPDLSLQSYTPIAAKFDAGDGNPPAALSGVRQVVAGDAHTCAVSTNDNVLCWGANDANQLADASAGTMRAFASDIGFNNVQKLAAGDKHTCALRNDSTVWCWGRNSEGQLGISRSTTTSASPVQVRDADDQPLTAVRDISAGDNLSCAVLASGALYCWGLNADGQLGASSNVPRSDAAIPVTAIDSATAVACGGNHVCALRHGQILCWGLNTDGQLGNNSLTSSRFPSTVPIDLAP
jgi:alpha-tubulin suppressor-like RCC1 family protein